MKRMLKVIALTLVTLLALVSLCSCDNLFGTTKKPEDNTNKTTKIDFAQAAENYEKKSVKKSDITVSLKATIFTDPEARSVNRLKESYDIGSAIKITRTQENDKIYIAAKVVSDETDEKVSGVIDTIIKALNLSSLPGLNRLNGLNETFKDFIVKYLTYANHYTTGQIDLGANLGVQNGTYNLKAYYNDKQSKESDHIWFVANDESLSAWLDNNTQLDVTENRINTYLMKTIFSQITDKSSFFDKDNANKYVDKNGRSSYDISLKADVIVSSLLSSGFLDILGATDKSGALTRYADYFSDVKRWFTVEAKNVTAEVNNELPQSIRTGFTVDLNILVPNVIDIIQTMYRDGVIDEKSSQISTGILNLVSGFLCGTKGQTDAIGIKLNADFCEDFSYKASECKLSDEKYTDYFLSLDAQAEGRVDLNDYVIGVITNKGAFVADYLLTLGKEYEEKIEAIRDEIMQKATEIEEKEGKITKEQLLSIAAEVILRYKTDDPENDSDPLPDEQQPEQPIGG